MMNSMTRRFTHSLLIVAICLAAWIARAPGPALAQTCDRIVASDSNEIAFVSSRNGNWDIYVMNADGTSQRNLTNNRSNDTAPAWSPDGEKIAFTSWRSGFSHIWVMDADGKNPVDMTPTSHAQNLSAAWSPDSDKIAFMSTRDDGKGDIIVMDANGKNPKNLTKDSRALDHHPAWSPDGKKIAFMSMRDRNQELYVMDADGSNVTRLTNTMDAEDTPTWSPDGKRIAFADKNVAPESEIAVDNTYQLYIMNADGSNPDEVTEGGNLNYAPDWSPDGKWIAFESTIDNPRGIYIVDPDNYDDICRLSAPYGQIKGEDWYPAWRGSDSRG